MIYYYQNFTIATHGKATRATKTREIVFLGLICCYHLKFTFTEHYVAKRHSNELQRLYLVLAISSQMIL